ncbi:ATP-dependent DNA ligase [Rhodococcoides kroppenstedtii]|uniref:ATP-dependent DNA ligase n=1 Tax=Rhodococcoides kroppenstedtii TaxID=293050 RepID=UPI001427D434|nr:ATP-dependent DNA ligase [Rhodococcus kroppenstedtii]NIL82207.1 DNA ligase B [Rhodococcus kroppenstedtii]
MDLARIVDTSATVAATRSRKAKVAALAELLGECTADEVGLVVRYASGMLRQRRTGLGWRGLARLPRPAEASTLTVTEVDGVFERLSELSGPGSQRARAEETEHLFGRAAAAEQTWLRGLVTGELRQGALDALVQEAVAAATDLPLAAVRRAAMLSGSTPAAAEAAVTGGEDALAAIGLTVGRPVSPMLASSAPTVTDGTVKAAGTAGGPVALDTKLDGIRIQVHRTGDEVSIATRSLDDITSRLPEVVDYVRSLPVDSVVLDGEALALGDDGRPRPFQDTASRTAQATGVAVTPYFFDVLHVDGDDLLDRPWVDRIAVLDRLVDADHRVPRLTTADAAEAERFAASAVAAGHEGVVIKNPAAKYEAGRRGAAWVKVKPVFTVDLVVLAVEWGSGRRTGLLSNLHLGAIDPAGGFVMLGKTFKGMTDEMLAWQTERFLGLETHRSDHVVHVQPVQVVEIAIDGLQRSTRYPGGIALRFARVVRYRDDKTAEQADTVESVKALFGTPPT